ncbi:MULTISPECIES: TonB-dependent receptor [unclassified Chitinophaga]|uniref:TonB-dependent receptor n=1 Tax=unclassified Chitinophaga TaxID=2619133 RepID=UPI00301030B7
MQNKLTLRRRNCMMWFLSLLFLFGFEARAQDNALRELISLSMSNTRLDEVVKAISQQSSLTFSYDRSRLSGIKIEKVQWQAVSLQNVLSELNALTGVEYVVNNGTIAIRIGQRPVQAPSKRSGKITGKVFDEQNGQPVPGATIRIGGNGTATDMEGAFSFVLPEGNYIATVSSIGYGIKEVDEIVVKNNQVFQMDVTLKRGKGQLAGVTVTASARKESIAALYVRQKNNAAVSDGISAEQIRVTPDNNAAQVLKRISGLTVQDDKFVTVRGLSERYNTVILNGAILPSSEPNRRNFAFDVVPSSIIDNIVVNKTATPDMPSEFAGGLVQVNTRDIPAENFTTVGIGGGWNTNSTGKDLYSLKRGNKEYLGVDDGTRNWWRKNWNADQYWKYSLSGDNVKTSEMNTHIPNNWGLRRYGYTPQQQYQLSLGRKIPLKNGASFGVTLAGTYRNEQQVTDHERYQPSFYYYDSANSYQFNTTIGAVANVGFQTKGHKVAFKNLYNRKFSHETDVNYGKEFDFRVGIDPAGDDVLYYTDIVLINEILQNRLEGEHLLHQHLKLDWSADYITVNRDQPDTRASQGYNVDGPKGYYQYVLNDGTGFITRGLSIFNSTLKERRKNINLNFTIPFQVGHLSQSIKAGYAGTFRSADFKSASLRLLHDPAGNSGTINDAIYGQADYQLQSLLKPGYLTYKFAGPGGSGYAGENYTGDQKLHAAYLMADLKFLKKFRLIGGIRMEKNSVDVHGISYNKITGIPVDSLMKYEGTDWLPSFNLVYNLTPSTNIRLAYSKTLARADFRERAPFIYYEFHERSIYRGAVGLKDAQIENMDLRYEYYPGPGEVLSFSAFYKKFRNPVELIGFWGAGKNVNYFFFNLERSTSKGIEVDIRKSLGFLHSPSTWLQKIFVSANASLMEGKVEYSPQALMNAAADAGGVPDAAPGSTRNRLLQGLSPYTVNAGIGYFGNVAGINVSYNRFGKRIANGGFNPWQDQYENERDVLDLQFSVSLLKNKMQVRLNISDLLQQDYVIYQNVSATGPRSEGGGQFLFDSVEDQVTNANSNHDPKGTAYNKSMDYVHHKWFKGRNVSMNINYNF